jgi:hypothetical protein
MHTALVEGDKNKIAVRKDQYKAIIKAQVT